MSAFRYLQEVLEEAWLAPKPGLQTLLAIRLVAAFGISRQGAVALSKALLAGLEKAKEEGLDQLWCSEQVFDLLSRARKGRKT